MPGNACKNTKSYCETCKKNAKFIVSRPYLGLSKNIFTDHFSTVSGDYLEVELHWVKEMKKKHTDTEPTLASLAFVKLRRS